MNTDDVDKLRRVLVDLDDSYDWRVRTDEADVTIHVCGDCTHSPLARLRASHPGPLVVHTSREEMDESIRRAFAADPATLVVIRNRRPADLLGAYFTNQQHAIDCLRDGGMHVMEWMFTADKEKAHQLLDWEENAYDSDEDRGDD